MSRLGGLYECQGWLLLTHLDILIIDTSLSAKPNLSHLSPSLIHHPNEFGSDPSCICLEFDDLVALVIV